MSQSAPDHSLSTHSKSASLAEIDASCRLPVLSLLWGGAIWLVVATLALLLASMSFHSPAMFADSAALSYGRMAPVANNALLYGFCVPAAWTVALWMLARLGRTKLSYPFAVIVGAKIWHLGVMVGVIGILLGDSSGFEKLEFPTYAACLLLTGSLLIGVSGVITLRERAESEMHPSQWFAGLSLFWFPWVYFTAVLLLQVWPVRGVAQVAVHNWFLSQFQLVMLGMVGIGALFYFVPMLRQQPLHSRYLALFALITFVFFGGWVGLPMNSPLPAWMGALSEIMSVFVLLPVIAVAMNLRQTANGPSAPTPEGRFFTVGLVAFVAWALFTAIRSIPAVQNLTTFTLVDPGMFHLLITGFIVVTLLGASYFILPRVAGLALPFPSFVRAHFWLATLGMLLLVVPFLVGGIQQGMKLANADIPFTDVAKSTLMPIRVASLGELFLVLGSLLLAANVAVLLLRLAWSRVRVFKNEPVGLEPAEVKA